CRDRGRAGAIVHSSFDSLLPVKAGKTEQIWLLLSSVEFPSLTCADDKDAGHNSSGRRPCIPSPRLGREFAQEPPAGAGSRVGKPCQRVRRWMKLPVLSTSQT